MRIAQEDGFGGDQPVELGEQLIVLQRPVDLSIERGRKAGHHRERCLRLGSHFGDVPVDIRAVEATVEGDHLAVQPVKRPQSQVTVLGQLGEGEIAVVGAVEQGRDRRGLEEHVRFPPRVQFGLAQRLHVQRSDPALVQHAASLPGHMDP